MSKIKMFVIEDDFIHANRLEMYLDEMGYELAASATSASEALNKIAATQPDLLLVDIYLEGDRDGVEMVEHLNQKNPIPVIFITSHRDKETFDRAKLTNPYAYIIKPYEKETLQAAIELAIYRFTKTSSIISVGKRQEDSYNGWEEDQLIRDTLFVKSEGKLIKIDIEEILYVEVRDKLCLIGVDKEIFPVRISLQKLERNLTGSRFLRVHRSFIINKKEIHSVDPSKNEVIVHEHVIPIGRSYREAFLNNLDTLSD